MSFALQSLLAYATVAVAMGWLLRRFWVRRRNTSCDGCQATSSAPPEPAPGIRLPSLRVLR